VIFASMTATPDADEIDLHGRAALLTPGTTVTAEVKTGSGRILEYVFSPLVETTSGAVKERRAGMRGYSGAGLGAVLQ
jgi:hemolysin D